MVTKTMMLKSKATNGCMSWFRIMSLDVPYGVRESQTSTPLESVDGNVVINQQVSVSNRSEYNGASSSICSCTCGSMETQDKRCRFSKSVGRGKVRVRNHRVYHTECIWNIERANPLLSLELLAYCFKREWKEVPSQELSSLYCSGIVFLIICGSPESLTAPVDTFTQGRLFHSGISRF